MKKLKNWIIKKLGGYTKEEFRAITDVHYKFFPQNNRNIITLRANGYFGQYDSPPQDYLENRLIECIAKQLKHFVRWEDAYDPITQKRTISANIKVVDDRQNGD